MIESSTEPEDPYVTIQTSVIPEVSEVRIYESTIQHVIDHHPEIGRNIHLPVFRAAVHSTLENPTSVEPSHNNSFVFVDENTTDVRGQPLRVPVRVVTGTSARMKTAYFASRSVPIVPIFPRGSD